MRNFFWRGNRKLYTVATLGILAFLIIFIGLNLDSINDFNCSQAKSELLTYGKGHPLLVICTVFLGTFIGMPISMLYFLTTALYGIEKALLLNMLMIGAQVSLTYALTVYCIKDPIRRFLQRKGYTMTIPSQRQTQLTLLLRIIPAAPITIQSAILAIGGVNFWRYLLVSWPILTVWMVGIVISSGSLLEGHMGLGITGAGLIVTLILLTRFIRQKHGSLLSKA